MKRSKGKRNIGYSSNNYTPGNNQNLDSVVGSCIEKQETPAILNELFLPYQSLDPKGIILEVNDAWCSLFGYSKGEILGTNIAILHTPRSMRLFNKVYPRFVENGKVYNVQFEMKTSDGWILTVRLYSKAVYNIVGDFLHSQCFLVDVSDTKLNRDKLKTLNKKLNVLKDEIKVQESNFRLLVENQNDCVIKIDPDGRFLYVSPGYCKLFGEQEEGLIGKKFMPLVYPDDRKQTLKAMKNLYKEPYSCYHEERAMTIHGWRWMAWSDKAVLDDKNNIQAIIGVGRDIHEQIIAKEEALLAGKQWESTFNTISDPLLVLDANNKIIRCNKAFESLAGKGRDKLIGQHCYQVLHELNYNLAQCPFFRSKKSHYREEMELVVGKRIFTVVVDPLLDKMGNFNGVVHVMQEITSRKKVETALKVSEARFKEAFSFLETLIDAIPDVIGVLDTNFRVIRYNKAGYAMLNKTQTEVAGRYCYDLIGNKKPCKICATSEAIRTKKPSYIEKYLPETDTYLDVYAYPVLDEKGKVYQIIEHIHNNTARRRDQKALEEAKSRAEESDKLKSAFLANLSHEIRTPLNGILGFTSLMRDPSLSYETQSHYIDIVHKSGNHLLSVINDIIEISRIDTGQIKPIHKAFDVYAMMVDVYGVIKVGVPVERDLKLTLSLPGNALGLMIETDEIKLRQVMLNLLSNAIKFTPKGAVDFGFNLGKQQIEFFVQDTGIGIDEKYHQVIFERFRQIESNLPIQKGGSGLGLAISKAYVEMLGSKLSIESAIGKGSRFGFALALKPAISVDGKTEDFTHPARDKKVVGKLKILIAEDNDINYAYLAELLKSEDFSFQRAANGQEAIEMVKQIRDFDLILMDIKMPLVNGYEALKSIRKINPGIKVIAQTAYALSKEIKKIKKHGFDDYLIKPILPDQLKNCIHHQLGVISTRP